MEKYTEFNDPVTGINPYLRPLKYELSFLSVFTSFILFRILFSLPAFIRKYTAGTLSRIVYENKATENSIKKGRIFMSTYSSLFDLPVLYKILHNPTVYLIRDTEILEIDRKNIIHNVQQSEVEQKIKGNSPVVFLMGGGLTNGEVFISTREIEKIADPEYVISLQYEPNLAYDINLFDIKVYPHFRSEINSFFYHLIYYSTIKKDPICKVSVADTLYDLSERTGIEISTALDSKATLKFLKLFNFDQ